MATIKPMPSKENIILVDPRDKKIGIIEKIIGHQYAMLHRAFSVFIFRKIKGKLELLLQQRSETKYHGGGLWTNTCCSHPRPGEKISVAAEKRLQDEMGISCKLKKAGKFHYTAQLNNGMTENEIDHVFYGFYDRDEIEINPDEVADYKWITIPALQKDMQLNPKKYTPWLKEALELVLKLKIS